jgi:hypothetical protein
VRNFELPGHPWDWHVYPSGGMSGLPDHNTAQFRHVTRVLRGRGYDVVSPHEVRHGGNGRFNAAYAYEDYLRDDILTAQAQCNVWLGLPGWTRSRGSRDEFNFAAATGMLIFFWDAAREEMIRMDEWLPGPGEDLSGSP